MSDGVRGIVVSHAGLSHSLVDAVERVLGPTDDLVAVTNEGCDRRAILERLTEAVGDDRPAVVFVDLPGGSCYAAAAHLQRERPDVSVVAGVNLPMLLDFVMHAREAPAEAVAHAVEAGSKAISVIGP